MESTESYAPPPEELTKPSPEPSEDGIIPPDPICSFFFFKTNYNCIFVDSNSNVYTHLLESDPVLSILRYYNVFFSDSGEKPTHIRFLVSNAAAGSVIGKGGSTITEFQAKSGARIQLSRNQEFFPGTTDRIIMISGSIKEVVNGLELILDKLHSEVITAF